MMNGVQHSNIGGITGGDENPWLSEIYKMDFSSLSKAGRTYKAAHQLSQAKVRANGSIDFSCHENPSNIMVDIHGRVVEVRLQQTKRTFSYDVKGNLDCVKAAGQTMLRRHGYTWLTSDNQDSGFFELTVTEDGALICRHVNGKFIYYHADGNTTIFDTSNTSMVWSDAFGRPLKIWYPSGKTRAFEYSLGRVSAVIEPDGKRLVLKGAKWKYADRSECQITNVEVRADGTVSYVSGSKLISITASELSTTEDLPSTEEKVEVNPQGQVGIATETFKSNDSDVAWNSRLTACTGTESGRKLKLQIAERQHLEILIQQLSIDLRRNELNAAESSFALELKLTDEKNKTLRIDPIEDSDLPIKFRLGMAAYNLSRFLFCTIPTLLKRSVLLDGESIAAIVSDETYSATWFERKVLSKLDLCRAEVCPEDVLTLFQKDKVLRLTLEEAIIERLIFGDIDEVKPAGNFVIAPRNESYKILNIDLRSAFCPYTVEPTWFWNKFDQALTKLIKPLCSLPLLESTIEKIALFLSLFDHPVGRKQIAKMGLYSDEIEPLLIRAKWFIEHKIFPPD